MLLGKYDSSDSNMRINLENLHEKLSVYVSFYRKSYSVLYPVYFFLGIFFGALDTGMDAFLNRMQEPKTIAYLAGIAGIFFISSFIITNFYLKKLYGNHLNKLKELLDELQA